MPRSNLPELSLFVVAASCIVAFLFIGIASVLYPHDLDSYEGILFLPALRISSGQPIYGIDVVLREPFMFATYGPLYYTVLGFMLKLTGVTFLPGRLMSLLATAATAFVIYRAVKREDAGSIAGVVAVAVFLIMPPAWVFGAIQRVDALGVFFTLLAVVISFSVVRRSYLMLAGGFAALAFLTKPTLIAAGVSITICLLFSKRLKDLSWFVAGGACVVAAGVLMMVLSGNGGYLFNLSSANLPLSFRWYLTNFRVITQSHTVFACVVIAAVALVRFRPRESKFSEASILVYLLVSSGLAVVTCGRVGADVNYFYEPVAALAIVVGFELGKLKAGDYGVLKTAASMFLLMALLTDVALFRLGAVRGRVLLPLRKEPVYAEMVRTLAAYVPENEPVATDYQDLALRINRPIYFNDMTVYGIGSEAMQSRFQSYVNERRLAAVISYQRRALPGYKLAGEEYSDPGAGSGQYNPGPLLYLRDDLWQKYDEASGRRTSGR